MPNPVKGLSYIKSFSSSSTRHVNSQGSSASCKLSEELQRINPEDLKTY